MRSSFIVVAVIAEQELQARVGFDSYKVSPYDSSFKVDGKHEVGPRVYDISEPVYTCLKPGYSLIGDECVSETRVESRLECPPLHVATGEGTCLQRYNPTLACRVGRLGNGICETLEVLEADLQCPVNTNLGADGICSILEPVAQVDVCPEGTVASANGCLAVEYSDPLFVCPPDTVIDGKKCRREVVSYKYKTVKPPRILAEEESFEALFAEALDTIEREAQTPEAAMDGAAAVVAVSPPTTSSVDGAVESDTTASSAIAGEALKPKSTMKSPGGILGVESNFGLPPLYFNEAGAVVYETEPDYAVAEIVATPLPLIDQWVPAQPVKVARQIRNRPAKAAENWVDAVQWERVQVPVPRSTKSLASGSTVNPKLPKPTVAQQVVKVQTQAAERVCPVGTRYGSTCVTETLLPPRRECPVPAADGACARRVAVAPVASCHVGTLSCLGRVCRCELVDEAAPVATCPAPSHFEVTDNTCVHEVTPRRLCPLGFFLDADGVTCLRRDSEPALCLFSVTYNCTDCDPFHAPLARDLKKQSRKFLSGESRRDARSKNKEDKDDVLLTGWDEADKSTADEN